MRKLNLEEERARRKEELERFKARADQALERALARHRPVIERKLTSCVNYLNRQFDPASINTLAMDVVNLPEMLPFMKSDWKHLVAARGREKIFKATIAATKHWWRETSPETEQKLTATQFEIAHYERFFGKGKKPGSAWAFAARIIGPHVLAALQSADKAAGRKPHTGYGAPDTSPILDLIRDLIEPVCERCGEPVPDTPAIRDVLLGRERQR
jgi:hypothetical protein